MQTSHTNTETKGELCAFGRYINMVFLSKKDHQIKIIKNKTMYNIVYNTFKADHILLISCCGVTTKSVNRKKSYILNQEVTFFSNRFKVRTGLIYGYR